MASELAQDGTVILTSLANPAAGLGRAIARRRVSGALALATVLSLVATGLVLPAIDVEAVAGEALRGDMTPHERGQAIETASKLFQVTTWAKAALGPTVNALLLTLALWLAFWVAGAKATFKGTLTVAAIALVPQALRGLLSVPAALAHAPVTPGQLSTLLPSSLAALLPPSLPGPALAAAHGLDLFTLWTLALVGLGMQRATGASPRRAWVVVLVLFAAFIALFEVVPAASGGGS